MTTQILESGNDHYKPRLSDVSRMRLIPPTQYQCAGSPRRSVSYCKLKQPPLRLTVLKLDGSSFGIEVSKMGTVGDLKKAVEAAFAHLPKEGHGRVSWEYIWGQFCLCHEGEMLLNDKDYISMLGMKDGDQLQFIHHASSTNNFIKIKSKGAVTDEENETRENRYKNWKKEDNIHEDIVGEKQDVHLDLGADNAISQRDHRLSLLLTSWFPYRKFSSPSSRMKDRGCSSRSSRNVLGSFFRFSGNKYDSRRLTWKTK